VFVVLNDLVEASEKIWKHLEGLASLALPTSGIRRDLRA